MKKVTQEAQKPQKSQSERSKAEPSCVQYALSPPPTSTPLRVAPTAMHESRIRSSILLRMLLVSVMTLVLLIPTVMVESTIRERQDRRTAAVAEISRTWGAAQALSGPAITVPLVKTVRDEDGSTKTVRNCLHIFPESLQVKGDLSTEVRRRGLYEAVLYNGRLTLSGRFDLREAPQLKTAGREPLWDAAYVSMGITDLRGIRDEVAMQWNGSSVPGQAGLRTQEVAPTGITLIPPIDPRTPVYEFSVTLSLNGTSDLQFIPTARRTDVSLSSPWKDPSFIGSFLPEQREVDDAGFVAHWTVLETNRDLPHARIGAGDHGQSSAFGVRLLQAVDEYQETYRTAKYAILIISLTFLAIFLSEVLSGELFHPVQYALVGLALVLFFVLVLAISEHAGFVVAYLTSAAVVVAAVGLYTRAIARRKPTPFIVAGVLGGVFGFLFVVLRIEDYALLAGALGLLMSLLTLMYLTRRVDWFSMGSEPKSVRPESPPQPPEDIESLRLT
jgi:inner membrane protein